MSESTKKTTTQIKLLVNTASEAVSLIKERYGEQARVLSVKQVEAGGLKRLISKPRLEVIVEIFEQPSTPAVAAQAVPAQTPSASVAAKPSPAAPSSQSPIGDLYSKNDSGASNDYFSQFEDPAPKTQEPVESEPEEPVVEQATLGSAANPVRRGTIDAVSRVIPMLESVGFDRSLIERARCEIDFKDVGSEATMTLYAKICDWLRSQFPDTSAEKLGNRRAFIGCCGVGKTSALSKMLSNDVFVKGLTPTVLKVDSEMPNPSDALEIFSEIMGAPLVRSLEEIDAISEFQPLLVDMPGYRLSEMASIQACRDSLDRLEIDERILVVNAAYEAELIAEMMAAGESIGATRVVFTHLDETRRAGKLWKFLLNRRLRPLFFSDGPNPAGDYTSDTYSALLERSFPNGRSLAAAARKTADSSSAQISEEISVNA